MGGQSFLRRRNKMLTMVYSMLGLVVRNYECESAKVAIICSIKQAICLRACSEQRKCNFKMAEICFSRVRSHLRTDFRAQGWVSASCWQEFRSICTTLAHLKQTHSSQIYMNTDPIHGLSNPGRPSTFAGSIVLDVSHN